jgi:diketogulonate reductase-like aldo/keto reductase
MQPRGYRSLDSGHELRKFSARSEIFLVTKVWTDHLAYPEVIRAAHGSLKRLGVDQIDLYLVHWPRASMPVADTMRAVVAIPKSANPERQRENLGVFDFELSADEMVELGRV